MIIRMKRETVLQHLNDKLPLVQAADDKALAEHRAKNKKVAAARRKFIDKLDDDKLAELSFNRWDGHNGWPEGTSCPVSQADALRKVITSIERDSRQIYQIDASPRDYLYMWISYGDPKSGTVCK